LAAHRRDESVRQPFRFQRPHLRATMHSTMISIRSPRGSAGSLLQALSDLVLISAGQTVATTRELLWRPAEAKEQGSACRCLIPRRGLARGPFRRRFRRRRRLRNRWAHCRRNSQMGQRGQCGRSKRGLNDLAVFDPSEHLHGIVVGPSGTPEVSAQRRS